MLKSVEYPGNVNINMIRNDDFYTPLHIAVNEGSFEMVEFLILERKADVNVVAKNKRTPL